jgi:hypothetical protein
LAIVLQLFERDHLLVELRSAGGKNVLWLILQDGIHSEASHAQTKSISVLVPQPSDAVI